MDKKDLKQIPISLKYNLVKDVGLAKAIVLSCIHEHIDRKTPLTGSVRALTKVIPLSKSTIAKAINELVIDTYLTELQDGSYTLTKTYYDRFNI